MDFRAHISDEKKLWKLRLEFRLHYFSILSLRVWVREVFASFPVNTLKPDGVKCIPEIRKPSFVPLQATCVWLELMGLVLRNKVPWSNQCITISYDKLLILLECSPSFPCLDLRALEDTLRILINTALMYEVFGDGAKTWADMSVIRRTFI